MGRPFAYSQWNGSAAYLWAYTNMSVFKADAQTLGTSKHQSAICDGRVQMPPTRSAFIYGTAITPLKYFKGCNFLSFGNLSSAAPIWQQSPATCLSVIWEIDIHLRLHLLFTSGASGTAVLKKQTGLWYLLIASGSGFAAPSSLLGFTLRRQSRVWTWLHVVTPW